MLSWTQCIDIMSLIKIEYEEKKLYCEVPHNTQFIDIAQAGNWIWVTIFNGTRAFQSLFQSFQLLNYLINFIFIVADNFDVSIQNSLIEVADHQGAKLRTAKELQHVISKCADNIDLFIKVHFGVIGAVHGLITPQVNSFAYIFDGVLLFMYS